MKIGVNFYDDCGHSVENKIFEVDTIEDLISSIDNYCDQEHFDFLYEIYLIPITIEL